VARGFFVFSLISALMAVYYATTQQRTLGRLLRPEHVRAWIRGGISRRRLDGNDLSPCDPQDLDHNVDGAMNENILLAKCFTPSVISVITISAPQMLLSGSLMTLLLGLGIYFGFTWTSKLDTQAGLHDSRNVFIVFVVGLGVCIIVYSLSGLIHNTEDESEDEILRSHMNRYRDVHPI
jgi:hypothetical protein